MNIHGYKLKYKRMVGKVKFYEEKIVYHRKRLDYYNKQLYALQHAKNDCGDKIKLLKRCKHENNK